MTWVKTVFIVGPAGSGKTTLTSTLGRYLEEQNFKVCYVNLDAAVEDIPYEPDFDIRTYYTVSKIMKEEKIGPNLALIRSVELLLKYENDIKNLIEYVKEDYDYILVDTPGQLELTIFHEACIKIMKLFSERTRSCIVFLIPADIIRSVRDIAFLKLMALAIRYRIDVPVITAISKIDLNPNVENILNEGIDVKDVELAGTERDLVYELWNTIKKIEKKQRIVKICSITGEGLEDLHTLIYEVFCTCGDLT